jgi:hypothetical protein
LNAIAQHRRERLRNLRLDIDARMFRGVASECQSITHH